MKQSLAHAVIPTELLQHVSGAGLEGDPVWEEKILEGDPVWEEKIQKGLEGDPVWEQN